MSLKTLEVKPETAALIEKLSELKGVSPELAATLALKYGLEKLIAQTELIRRIEKRANPTETPAKKFQAKEIPTLSASVRPMVMMKPVQRKEKPLPVNYNTIGIDKRMERRPVESTMSLGCVCNLCDTVFEVTANDQDRLRTAKTKTGGKIRCEKCGGNEEMLRKAGV